MNRLALAALVAGLLLPAAAAAGASGEVPPPALEGLRDGFEEADRLLTEADTSGGDEVERAAAAVEAALEQQGATSTGLGVDEVMSAFGHEELPPGLEREEGTPPGLARAYEKMQARDAAGSPAVPRDGGDGGRPERGRDRPGGEPGGSPGAAGDRGKGVPKRGADRP